MKKLIALTAILALLASVAPAMATFGPQASTQLYIGTTGTTTVATSSAVYNLFPNNDTKNYGGVIENVYNDESLSMFASNDFYKDWTILGFTFIPPKMVESKIIQASGNTEIIKQTNWIANGFAVGTANTYIKAGFGNPSYAYDEVDVTQSGNLGDNGIVLYNAQTSSPIYYIESFGFNKPTDCTPIQPTKPIPPSCTGSFCPW